VKLAPVVEPAAKVNDIGEKVPPAPLSEGVITVADESVAFGVAINTEGEPTIPLFGPDNVTDVAETTPALTENVIGDPVTGKP
jgi:hypothetical protein